MSNWYQCESKARWKAPVKKRRREKSEVKIEKGNAEWSLRRWNLPEQLDFDPPLKIWAWGKDDLGLDLDEDSDGLRGERIGVDQV
jgi:hypothetical protein